MESTDRGATQRRDAFADRLLRSTAGAFDIITVYLGDQLGYYRALAEHGPLTSPELAARTATNERYAREWLEQQTVAGILEIEGAPEEPEHRRFRLPPGHDEVLADGESLNYLAPLAQLVMGAIYPLASVLDAYRSGRGVPFEAYGRDLREGQARMNRAMFLQQLGQEWLPAIPDLHARLQSDPPARVADVGCGAGWSSIGIAKSYPRVLVDGYDLDPASIAMAQDNALQAGLAGRVRFHLRDAADPQLASRYDLVAVFEALHDMSNPVAALRAMRALAREGGAVLVVDERVGEAFTPSGEGVEWMMYGWSVLHCLPVGLSGQPSAATGTVMRPPTLRRYAREAGFTEVDILPIDHLFFRFYRLR